jgi:glycosyltransferase involved in cell wall biosynthesis
MKHIKNEKVRMVIAGDGPERDKIMKEAEGESRVYFAGLIPHNKIAPYYMMADIILIPSITSHGVQEATSLAMLEGMACGKVTICSNIGGMREIIQHMKSGILTKEKDPGNIAEIVETVIENKELTAELGRYARDYVLKNHSYVVHAEKIAEIYSNVLGEGKNG